MSTRMPTDLPLVPGNNWGWRGSAPTVTARRAPGGSNTAWPSAATAEEAEKRVLAHVDFDDDMGVLRDAVATARRDGKRWIVRIDMVTP